MTEIKYHPIKQMIVLELIQENVNNFMHRCAAVGQTWDIWVNGIILNIDTFPNSYEKYKNFLQGIEMFERVTFVKIPKYVNEIKWSGGNYRIAIVDYSSYPSYVELSEWIKTQPIWNQRSSKIQKKTPIIVNYKKNTITSRRSDQR